MNLESSQNMDNNSTKANEENLAKINEENSTKASEENFTKINEENSTKANEENSTKVNEENFTDSEQKIEFEIKITASDLYNYMMKHLYSGMQGIISIIVGVIVIALFIMTKYPLYLILAIVVLGYLPWALFLKSRQQALSNPSFKQPLKYTLVDNGVTVSQGEVSETQAWKYIYKVKSSKRSIFVYTSPINACIFPRKQLGDKEKEVIAYIKKHVNSKACKI